MQFINYFTFDPNGCLFLIPYWNELDFSSTKINSTNGSLFYGYNDFLKTFINETSIEKNFVFNKFTCYKFMDIDIVFDKKYKLYREIKANFPSYQVVHHFHVPPTNNNDSNSYPRVTNWKEFEQQFPKEDVRKTEFFDEEGNRNVKTEYFICNTDNMDPMTWQQKAFFGSCVFVFVVSSIYCSKYMGGMTDPEEIKKYLQNPENRPSKGWGAFVTAGISLIIFLAKTTSEK